MADEVLDCIEPIEFFRLMFTTELVNQIVHFTNLYGIQELERMGPLPKRSRFRKWKPVTDSELNRFHFMNPVQL